MKEIVEQWKAIGGPETESLAEDSAMLHHAVQFIAYTANHFIAKEDDDSHTAMRWDPAINGFAGQTFTSEKGKFMMVLVVDPLAISIRDPQLNVIAGFDLPDRTKKDTMDWLTGQLRRIGLDTKDFDDRLHFTIPGHAVSEGGGFKYAGSKNARELAQYRSNGQLVIEHFAARYTSAQPLYVWPHHFDEACYVPLEKQHGSDIRSITFGLAMPDEFYKSAYFYVTAWSRSGIDYTHLPGIRLPGRWHTGDWTGQVLELASLTRLSREEQAGTAYRFMEEAIKNARTMAGWSYNG